MDEQSSEEEVIIEVTSCIIICSRLEFCKSKPLPHEPSTVIISALDKQTPTGYKTRELPPKTSNK
jgi:hypothetical protein